jgi:hypothetical protein
MKQNFGRQVAQFLEHHRRWKVSCSIGFFACLHSVYGNGLGPAIVHGVTWLWMTSLSRGSRQFHIPLAILPFLQFTTFLIVLFVFLELFLLWCMYTAKSIQSFVKNLYFEMACYSILVDFTMMYSNPLMATLGVMQMGTDYLHSRNEDVRYLPKSEITSSMNFLRAQTKEILHDVPLWRSFPYVLSRIDACLCYHRKKRIDSTCRFDSLPLLRMFVQNIFAFLIVSGTVPCDNATQFCTIAFTFLHYFHANHRRTSELLFRVLDPTKQNIVCRHKITAVALVFERREYLETNAILLPKSLRILLADYDQEMVETTPCPMCFFRCGVGIG